MNDIFFFKLLLSFLTGGAWVIITTLFSDRFGTKIGGAIGGLPSTVLFSLLFIGLSQSAEIAVAATTIIPAIGGVATLFMACYIYLVRKNFWLAILLSILLWCILSLSLVTIGVHTFFASLVIYLSLFLLSYYFVEHLIHVPAVSGKKIIYTLPLLFFRGVLSGGIVAMAVFLAKIGGPVLGGMFAIFPGATISIMFITYFEHGKAFSAAITKTILFSMTSVIVYALLVRYTYIPFGIAIGTAISLIGAVITTWALFHSLIKRAH